MGVNKRGFVHRPSQEHRKGGSRAMGFAAMSPERHEYLRLRGVAATQARVASKVGCSTKTCTKCKVEKAKSEFHQDKQKSDGLRPICKACTNAQINARNRKDPAPSRKRVREWQLKNREYVRAQAAQWRIDNAEHIKQLNAAYRENNKERCLAHGANRRARKRGAEGSVSPDIIPKLLKLQKGKCPCCGKPLGKDFHLDHIVPLIEGGTNADNNMQLLRKKCNLQKSRKDPVQFMQERGFLL